MSAIAGFLEFQRSRPETADTRRDLSRMLDAIAASRVTDARSIWLEERAALGILLELHTPEDAFERQPLADERGRYICLGDLRLDNRRELGEALRIPYGDLVHTPDSALVLGAWLRWGEQCAERLLGDFAFVILDRESHTVFAARDHLGVRPFYFVRTPDRIVFASAIKGLLALPDVPRALDEEGFADYLVLLEVDLARTCWQDVRRLPAGHVLTVDGQGGVRLTRYWQPEQITEQRLSSDGAYTEALQEAVQRAVISRMRTVHRTGVMLSGGLDSSTVACFAADEAAARGERLLSVSSVLPAGWSGPEEDEAAWIAQVVQSRSNIDPEFVAEPELGVFSGLDDVLAINDQPFRDIFFYQSRAIIERAAGCGVRNMLGGFGGDFIVSSYGKGFLAGLLRSGRVATLAKELLARRRVMGTSPWALFRGQVLLPMLPELAQRLIKRRPGKGLASYLAGFPIDPGYARRSGLSDRLRQALEQPAPRSVRESDARSLASRTTADYFEYWSQLAAAVGVRQSEPLLDKSLLELCLSIPDEIKVRDGMTRCLIRRAGEGVVPEVIRHRTTKSAFDPLFEYRMRRDRAEVLTLRAGMEDPVESVPSLGADAAGAAPDRVTHFLLALVFLQRVASLR